MQQELFQSAPGKGEQARRRLLLAALKKIGEKGYENASVREIADEAEQNLASISYYFGGKEKLYAQVLEGIGNYLRGLMGPLAFEADAQLTAGTLDPAGATAALKRILAVLLGKQLESNEFSKIRLVMMREQADPSESFGILYENTLRPLHAIFCRLIGVALGDDPESITVILRAHAIFGQVMVFTLCRATILRRLGIRQFGPEHVAAIAAIVDEHIDRICGGGPFKTNAS